MSETVRERMMVDLGGLAPALRAHAQARHLTVPQAARLVLATALGPAPGDAAVRQEREPDSTGRGIVKFSIRLPCGGLFEPVLVRMEGRRLRGTRLGAQDQMKLSHGCRQGWQRRMRLAPGAAAVAYCQRFAAHAMQGMCVPELARTHEFGRRRRSDQKAMPASKGGYSGRCERARNWATASQTCGELTMPRCEA